jgi:hypothetical protein
VFSPGLDFTTLVIKRWGGPLVNRPELFLERALSASEEAKAPEVYSGVAK